MTENDLLELVLNRLGNSKTISAIFGTDETSTWPPPLLNTFIENRLLRQAKTALVITCDGCEQYCPMPVTVLPTENSQPARAFVVCDKRDDIGRVPVDLKRLEQWEINGSLLAKKLSSLLGFDKSAKEENKGTRWTLGTLKGKERRSPLILQIENGVSIKIAGHHLPLEDLLLLENGTLVVDRSELLRLVNTPLVEKGTTYKLSTVKRESRKLISKARYAVWQKAYREWKRKKPGMSDVWYSRKIESTMDAENRRDAETIRKHMKK